MTVDVLDGLDGSYSFQRKGDCREQCFQRMSFPKSSAWVILVSMKCGEERASPKTVLMLTPCLRGEGPRTEHQRRQLTNILSLFTENGAPGTIRTSDPQIRSLMLRTLVGKQASAEIFALIKLCAIVVVLATNRVNLGDLPAPRSKRNRLTIEAMAGRAPIGPFQLAWECGP